MALDRYRKQNCDKKQHLIKIIIYASRYLLVTLAISQTKKIGAISGISKCAVLVFTMSRSIQAEMFQEMRDKTIFEQAKKYADNTLERQVYPTGTALANLQHFEETMPENATLTRKILSDLHQYGSPATVSQIGGRYFGLVNGGVVPAALAARWLADFWDQNTPLYVSSPIAAALETVTERWLRELFGLPDNVVAGFVSGSSMAILCGLAAARYRIYSNIGRDINKKV